MRVAVITVILGAALSFHAHAQTDATSAKQPPKWERALSEYLAKSFHFDSETDVLFALKDMIKLPIFLESRMYKGWEHDISPRTNNIRLTGPFINGIGEATHSRVRIYYSEGVTKWLRNGREGVIEDGSLIVKEMFYGDPAIAETEDDEITGWAVMVKDSKASFDGWLWYLQFRRGDKTYQENYVPADKTYPGFLAGQYGMSFCLACHASADNDQLTFATLDNIEGKNTDAYAYFQDAYNPMAPIAPKVEGQLFPSGTHATWVYMGEFDDRPGLSKPLDHPNPAIRDLYGRWVPWEWFLKKFPNDLIWDHVVPGPGSPAHFVSADSCRGCHDASALVGNKLPAMAVIDYERVGDQPNVFNQYNLSEWGEWSASLMGLSGRDPVFHAQLESERALRPEYADYISDFCLSCHAPMGQRTFHEKNGDDAFFTSDILYERSTGPHAVSAALGRDGVSCAVCHHIAEKDLGKPETFNAKFNLGPADEVYGPFDDPLTYPMTQAIGTTPVGASHIVDSKLCGSCHTVKPPRIPLYEKGKAPNPPPPPGTFPPVHEQTTYLEWLNSDFNDENGKTETSQSCAECHMPDKLPGWLTQNDPKSPTNVLSPTRSLDPLTFKIANVETGNFPKVDHRADYEKITPDFRPYRRHTLVGINVFTMYMIQQFPKLIGFTVPDAELNLMTGTNRPVWRLELAARESMYLGQNGTAELTIEKIKRTKDSLNVDVEVKNLAGHKFPTGVGFRRAFLSLEVQDAKGNVLWASGRTTAAGVITDANGEPLVSEFTTDWRELQPDFGPDNPITRQDQVQIYEIRTTNNLDQLTTSFLGLFHERKDNRILPAGWKPDGRYHEFTAPIALGGAVVINPDAGFDRMRYEIPMSDVPDAATVRVALYYQSLPPYYLQDRFQTDGPETKRLYYMTNYLNLEGTPMEDWKFELEEATRSL